MWSLKVICVPTSTGRALLLLLTVLLTSVTLVEAQAWEMSVCADPNTMPFSHRDETGFENRIADILSDELDASLNYVWWPQGQTMISGKLREGECDIIMGIPDGQDELLSTVAYYRSPHVFIYRADAPFEITSLNDEVLQDLRIGVQHTGIAPHEALLSRGLARNVVFQSGERGYGEQGTHRLAPIVEAVANGTVDVALAWGPVGGYYAKKQDVEMKVVPVSPEIEPPFLSMVLSMTIAVRPGDDALRDRLNLALSARWTEIQDVLTEYGVPRSPLPQPSPPPVVQSEQGKDLRVGLVVPTLTGTVTVRASLFDLIGEAASMGARLAEDDFSQRASTQHIDLLLASSPSPEAAERAGRRLVAIERVDALIGGIGRGQSTELAGIADESSLLFLNIGSPNIELRQMCNRNSFHIQASAAMYVDALINWYTTQGQERWFIISDTSEQGAALARQAEVALESLAGKSEIVGQAEVVPGQASYMSEFEAVRDAEAEVLLLLLPAEDQIPFLAQQQSFGLRVAIAPYPDPVTQTRNYMAAAWNQSRNPSLRYRMHLWETTLESGGAQELNQRYVSRWGKPMEPSAWAAYEAMSILQEAVGRTGTTDAEALIKYLEEPEALFDVAKGQPVGFRASDHQLRQPLYVVEIDHEAPWHSQVSKQLAVAKLADTVSGGNRGDEAPSVHPDNEGTSGGCNWQGTQAR